MKQREQATPTTKVTLSHVEIDALRRAALHLANVSRDDLISKIRDGSATGDLERLAVAEIDTLISIAKRLERALLRCEAGRDLQKGEGR